MIGAERRVYGDGRFAWGGPIALIAVVCLIVLSFSSKDLLAQTSENQDPRRTVSTRNATYTIQISGGDRQLSNSAFIVTTSISIARMRMLSSKNRSRQETTNSSPWLNTHSEAEPVGGDLIR